LDNTFGKDLTDAIQRRQGGFVIGIDVDRGSGSEAQREAGDGQKEVSDVHAGSPTLKRQLPPGAAAQRHYDRVMCDDKMALCCALSSPAACHDDGQRGFSARATTTLK
ncbi:MAG: hypothetical protein RLN67_13295, partial [Algiphilus sp.]